MSIMTPVLDLSSLQALQNELGSFGFNLELWQFGTPISATLHENSWSTYDAQHEPVFFGEHDHSVNDSGTFRTLDIETTLGHLDLSSLTLTHGVYDHYTYAGGLESWNGSSQSYSINTLQFTANPIPVTPEPCYLLRGEIGDKVGDKFDFSGCSPIAQSPLPPSTLTNLVVVDVDQDNFQYGGWSVSPNQGLGMLDDSAGGSWSSNTHVHQHSAVGATLAALFDDVQTNVSHLVTSEFHFGGMQFSSVHADSQMVRDAHWTSLGLLG